MPELVHPLRKVRNLGDVISATIETIRLHIKPLFFAVTKHAGPLAITGSVLLAVAQTFTLSASFSDILMQRQTLADAQPAYYFLQFIGMILVAFASITVANVVISYLQFVDNNEREPEAAELAAAMRWRTSKLLLTTIFVAFLFSAVISLAILAAVLLMRSSEAAFVSIPIVVLGFLYIIVPLIVLYPVVLFEDRGFFDALKRCRQLVKNKWWWTLGTAFMIALISSTINVLGNLPFYVVSGISVFMTNSGDSSEPNIIVQILSIIFGSFASLVGIYVSTITITGVTYIYWSHRERIEGVSLFDRIESIEIDNHLVDEPEP